MYHVSAQGVEERMINVHYYYYYILCPVSKITGHTLRPLNGSYSSPS